MTYTEILESCIGKPMNSELHDTIYQQFHDAGAQTVLIDFHNNGEIEVNGSDGRGNFTVKLGNVVKAVLK